MPGKQLRVSAIWHEQVHHARVTSLAVSSDGTTLYCGCDAAAPKLDEAQEPSVVAVAAADGRRQLHFTAPPSTNVRSLLVSFPTESQLSCIGSDGSVLSMDAASGELLHRTALPGTPAAAASATSPDSTLAAPEEEHAAAACPKPQPGETGPEFLAQAGYRGLKEGYLFREGSLGMGYYRKDVVRRYASAVPLTASRPSGQAGEAQAEVDAAAAAAERDRRRAFLRRAAAAPTGLRCVAVSEDRSLLVTPSPAADGSAVSIWRLSAGAEQSVGVELLAELKGHTKPVLTLALAPRGALLASAAYDQTIRVWRREQEWSCVRVLRGHGAGVRALAFSADGAVLYSAAADNTIRAWSTQHWVCLRTLHGRHEDATWPCCAALHPGGAGVDGPRPPLLVSASTGPFGASTLKAFDPGDGACLATFAHLGYDQRGDTSALAFSADGATLFSGASDGSVAAWALRWEEQDSGRAAGLRRGFF